MATPDPVEPFRPPLSVFLSYASEDRQAALIIRDALPAYGLEVWYDESALEGGDAWDQKIRRQIRECTFFMPVISARTESRHEGYFRREWRLAVERTLDMADDHTFLLPVVIDDTAQSGARVPEKFLAVQWSRLPGGQPTPAFEALCRRLASGLGIAAAPAQAPVEQPAGKRSPVPVRRYPEFPREEPGQKVRFWALAIVWPFQSAWVFFNSFPKWIRIILYAWLAVALLTKGCTGTTGDDYRRKATAEQTRKLAQISDSYGGTLDEGDVANLGAQIAKQLPGAHTDVDAGAKAGAPAALLVIPFSAPHDDPVARKLVAAAFVQVYGRLAISQHGQMALARPLGPNADPSAALEVARAQHSKYVLTGVLAGESGAKSLAVSVLSVDDGTALWTKSYPVSGADPAKIGAEVDAKMVSLEDD